MNHAVAAIALAGACAGFTVFVGLVWFVVKVRLVRHILMFFNHVVTLALAVTSIVRSPR